MRRRVDEVQLLKIVEERQQQGLVFDQKGIGSIFQVTKHAINNRFRAIGINPDQGRSIHEVNRDAEPRTHATIAGIIQNAIAGENRLKPYRDQDFLEVTDLKCSVGIIVHVRKKFGIPSCHERRKSYQEVDGNGHAPKRDQLIRDKIRELIETEDANDPITDRQLVSMVENAGVHCSLKYLRTIRRRNSIPPSIERKNGSNGSL